MAQINIKKNGVELTTSQVTKEKLSQMICTKNPTDGVAAAAVFMGNGGNPVQYEANGESLTSESLEYGTLYLEAFTAAGSPDDVYEVEIATSPKEVPQFAGRVTRGKLAKKIRMALFADEWQSELPAKSPTEKAPKDKGLPDLAI